MSWLFQIAVKIVGFIIVEVIMPKIISYYLVA